MNTSRVSEAENEIVEDFLREQREQSFEAPNISDDEAALTADIRKIARALAPQLSELEDVLKDFTATETADVLDQLTHSSNVNDVSRSMMEDEDDDLDGELANLTMSEQALREELEFAAGMSMLGSPMASPMGSPIPIRETPVRDIIDTDILPSPLDLNSRLEPAPAPSPTPQQPPKRAEEPEVTHPSAYTLQDHADYLQLKTEQTGLWYYIQMTSKLLPTAMSGTDEADDLVKDYCLPIPFRKLKRVYGGLVFYDVWESKRRKFAKHTPSRTPGETPTRTPGRTSILGATPVLNRLLQTPATSSNNSSATTPVPNTPGFTMAVPATPATPATAIKTPSNATTQQSTDKKPPRTPLQPINSSSVDKNNIEEPLPVRTVAIRVRPDVLCGAIMDAAHHAFEVLPSDCTTHIIKRQGAHLRGAIYLPKQQLAYVADIQLCTQKNDDLERRLLLRFYHIQDDPDALHELGQMLQRKQKEKSESHPQDAGNDAYTMDEDSDVMAQERTIANRHLKQTCSLIQRLMAAEKQKGGIKKMDHKQQSRYVCLPLCAKFAFHSVSISSTAMVLIVGPAFCTFPVYLLMFCGTFHPL